MIRLGILGTGMIVQSLLPHLNQVELASVSLLSTARSQARAQALVERYQLAGYFTDYADLLQSGVDAVYIALPNHLHFPYARQALEHGKHVICEKPLTSNVRELEILCDTARAHGVMLFEAMTIYHLPAYQAVQRAVGHIGPVKLVSFNYSQYSSRYNAFLRGEVLPVFDYQQSGGALMDINVYNVHALVGLFGAPAQVQYAANLARQIDTSGILLCSYPDFQAVCVGAKDCASQQPSVIQGERGTILIDQPLSTMTAFTTVYQDGRRETYEQTKPLNRMVYEFREFVRILEQDDRAACDRLMQYSLAAARMLEQARACAGIRFPSDP